MFKLRERRCCVYRWDEEIVWAEQLFSDDRRTGSTIAVNFVRIRPFNGGGSTKPVLQKAREMEYV
jgi:hypothetical protein